MLSLPKHLGRFVELFKDMYLNAPELTARIRLGKAVEQWLSYERETDYSFIRWLIISGDNKGLTVTYLESFDEGDSDFQDIYEFSVLDPEDAPYGIMNEFDSIEDALAFAVEAYGAATNKFVAGGMIQQEYANHLRQSN